MRSKKTVIAFGTFDVLHLGHIHYLKKAKALGDKLIVVVATDRNAERVKGKKPWHSAKERLKIIESLKMVDKAVIGLRSDKFSIIEKYRPDVIALGYDQKVDEEELKDYLKKKNLNAKVVRISAYKPQLYKSTLIKRSICKDAENDNLELGKDII